jgi:hypothetical protein
MVSHFFACEDFGEKDQKQPPQTQFSAWNMGGIVIFLPIATNFRHAKKSASQALRSPVCGPW